MFNYMTSLLHQLFRAELNDLRHIHPPTYGAISVVDDLFLFACVTPEKEREAELALSLRHANIVRCLGIITTPAGDCVNSDDAENSGGDAPFLVFENVPGTLLDLIQDTPGGLPLSEVRVTCKRCHATISRAICAVGT